MKRPLRAKAAITVAVLVVGILPVLAGTPTAPRAAALPSLKTALQDAPGVRGRTAGTMTGGHPGLAITTARPNGADELAHLDSGSGPLTMTVTNPLLISPARRALAVQISRTRPGVPLQPSPARRADPRLVSTADQASIRRCYNTTQNVWLTFDDGYTSEANLSSILGTLKGYHVRGRFFLVGSWARAHPAMVNQITAAGHYVENHTNTHPNLNQVSDAAVRTEIAFGQPANTTPPLLRPPYGAGVFTTRLYNLAARQGYRLCFWNSDTRDWAGISAAAIVSKVVQGDRLTPPTRPGDTILMHLKNTQTRHALATLIRALRAKGLTFDPLP